MFKKIFLVVIIICFVFALSGCKKKTLADCVDDACLYSEDASILMDIINDYEDDKTGNPYYEYEIGPSWTWNHDDMEVTMSVYLKGSNMTLTEIINERDVYHDLHRAVLDEFSEYDGDYNITVETILKIVDDPTRGLFSNVYFYYRIVTNSDFETTIVVDMYIRDNFYDDYINSKMYSINDILDFSEEGYNVIVSVHMNTLGIDEIQLLLDANSEVVMLEYIDLDENVDNQITDNIENLFLNGLRYYYTLLIEK